ncbi:MAG: hypothetical protein ACOYMG_11170 [Candidatus Methylumidiphilus sp.]
MKINKQIFAVMLLSTILTSTPTVCSAAANIGTWSFLQGTPAEIFNKQDWSIFEASINDTLDNAQDNESKSWENPKTKVSGEIEVLRTVNNAAHHCRLLKINNHAKDLNNEIELIFCKQPSGKWKIANPTSK